LTVFDSEGSNSSCSQMVFVNMPTFISISTTPSSKMTGFGVKIDGALFDIYGNGLDSKQLLFYYTFPGATGWSAITSTTTDTLGHYSIQWIPTASGYFTVKAEWLGNATHNYAGHNITLSVLFYQNQYALSVESNSTISGLVFNATSQKLTFITSGPNGTRGYSKVIIAKNLMPDIAKTKVFLDGTQIEYSYGSQDDSWTLTLTYNHGIHQIEIQFISSIKFLGLEWWMWIIVIIVMGALISGALIFYKRKRRTS